MKRLFILFAAVLMAAGIMAQDVIVTKDAKKIDAKILEVAKNEIRYKTTDNIEGPTYILPVEDIVCVIYANGKVEVYNHKQEETQTQEIFTASKGIRTEDLPDGLTSSQKVALRNYLDGNPKNIVAIKGDYSILYDKKNKIYFDWEYDSAIWVEYDHGADEYTSYGTFTDYLRERAIEIDKPWITKSACELFNKKLLGKKCTFLPIDKLDEASIGDPNSYKMVLHIRRVDVGSGAVSQLSSGRTDAGGAIIFGTIEIKHAATDAVCCVMVVDRVKGMGSVYEPVRIRQAVEETIMNKLFFIKEYDMYVKEIN